MMTRILATFAIVMFGSALVAGEMQHSADVTSKLEKQFTKLDVNDDGNLSREEADMAKSLKQSFAEADVDGSGNIDISEYVLDQTDATAAGEPMEDDADAMY